MKVCEYCWEPVSPKVGRYGRLSGWPRFCPGGPCAKASARNRAWSNRKFPAPPSDVMKPPKKAGVRFDLFEAPAEERIAA